MINFVELDIKRTPAEGELSESDLSWELVKAGIIFFHHLLCGC